MVLRGHGQNHTRQRTEWLRSRGSVPVGGPRLGTLHAMSTLALAALVLAVIGVYAVRIALRLSRWDQELALKSTLATASAVAVVWLESTGRSVPSAGTFVWWVVAAVYVVAPLVVPRTTTWAHGAFASSAVDLLYWTRSARQGMRRLLVRVALREGDSEAASRSMPDDDPVAVARLALLHERWRDALAVPLEVEGDERWLVAEAHVRALAAEARLDDAERLVQTMEREVARGASGPFLVRAVAVSRAWVAAGRGRLDEAGRAIDPPPLGVAAHETLALLATAASNGGQERVADEAWTRAYATAPRGWRERYAETLQRRGVTLPTMAPRWSPATTILTASLVAAFVGQTLLDRYAVPVPTPLGPLRPSSGLAAFLLGIPGVAGGEAWWRYLTYAAVHGNLLHIAFNAWVTLDLGRLYERRRAWGDLIAAFTFGAAMGAYLTHTAQAGDVVVLVGASGGVLGIGGALLADVLRGRRTSDRMLTRSLLQWMALIALISVAVPGVSLWGHVGGVVGGLLFGFARQGLPAGPRVSRAAGAVSIAVWVVAVASAVTVFVR